MSTNNHAQFDNRLIKLSPSDNVVVAGSSILKGELILVAGVKVQVPADVNMGHKLASRSIGSGEKIVKYGASIGSATVDIATGDHVHLHNMKSDYTATYSLDGARVEAEQQRINLKIVT